jgi:hypothetical protein
MGYLPLIHLITNHKYQKKHPLLNSAQATRIRESYQGAYFPDMLLTNAIIDSAIILNILVAAETALCNIY